MRCKAMRPNLGEIIADGNRGLKTSLNALQDRCCRIVGLKEKCAAASMREAIHRCESKLERCELSESGLELWNPLVKVLLRDERIEP